MEETSITNLIYTIRGKQVMLDSDLAILYRVETRVFNQAVKRNSNRFPERFCFQLTEEEYKNLRSQFVTSSEGNTHGGRRYMPYVFTDHGWLSARIPSSVVAFETRYPSRSPGMAKLLVRDCTSITLPKLSASRALSTSLGENEA